MHVASWPEHGLPFGTFPFTRQANPSDSELQTFKSALSAVLAKLPKPPARVFLWRCGSQLASFGTWHLATGQVQLIHHKPHM